MSKQLTLSATASVLAMAALVLSHGAIAARPSLLGAPMQTGATTEIAAPALLSATR